MGQFRSNMNQNIIKMAMELANLYIEKESSPIFLCVGSDKVVSDALAPITASILKNKYGINKDIFGNMEYNINSKNLQETIEKIKRISNKPICLIDATIGEECDIGLIKILRGGSFAKALTGGCLVGDFSILGVTNCVGVSNKYFLRNTKLKIVIDMANAIAKSIFFSLKIYNVLKANYEYINTIVI